LLSMTKEIRYGGKDGIFCKENQRKGSGMVCGISAPLGPSARYVIDDHNKEIQKGQEALKHWVNQRKE